MQVSFFYKNKNMNLKFCQASY